MEEEFVLVVAKHKYLDTIMLPCLIQKKSEQGFWSVLEIIRPQSSIYTSGRLTSSQKHIVEWASKYEDKTLVDTYSKKKLLVKDFFETLDKNIFTTRLKPFVESMHVRMIDAAKASHLRIFIRKDNANLYPEDEVNIEANEPGIIFSFDRGSEGLTYEQCLAVGGKTVSLLTKSYHVLSNSPCRIIIGDTLYATTSIESKKLVPFFSKRNISIPKKMEKEYFDSFILNAVQKYQVKARGFEVIEVVQPPQVMLSLDRDLSGNSCFILAFKYGNQVIEHGKKLAMFVDYSCDNDTYSYKKIYRDLDLEHTIYGELTQRGLCADKHLFLKTQQFLGEGLDECYDWLSNNVEYLSSRNVTVISPGKRNIMIQKPELVCYSTLKNDWFDLKTTIKIGDHMVPFIKLRSHILTGTREFEYENNVFVIPVEWFSRFSNVFLFAKQKGDLLSIQAQHVVSASELLGQGTSLPVNNLLRLFNTSHDAVEQPLGLNATLRPYQLAGFNWLYNLAQCNLGGCLADDMGLGKTLQTIALLLKNAETSVPLDHPDPNEHDLFGGTLSRENKKRTSLIVMPSSLVHNWFNEFQKFAPSLVVYKHVGHERSDSSLSFSKCDVVLTTYGLVRNDVDILSLFNFDYVILDESQMVKNPASKTYEAVTRLKARHRLVLTGTPIENSLEDLWAHINFVNPGMLGNLKFYRDHFVDPIEQQNSRATEHLKRLISPFILRRHKQEVLTELPSLQEQVVYCKMAEEQEKLYEQEKSKARNLILETKKSSSFNLLHQLLKLRQLANNPRLIDDTLQLESGKFEEVARCLHNVIDEGHKVLVFSSFVKHLDIFGEYLHGKGIGYTSLTGETQNRERIVSEFQDNTSIKVFLISIKAGGTGLNLTQADYVFLLDPWWNPAVEEQAIARAHRMGQTNKVFVYRFISENTIEEKIRILQENKSKLADMFVNENAIDFDDETMKYLLG